MNTITSTFASAIFLSISSFAFAQDSSLSFFVTGSSLGKGGNLGGLQGADSHCQKLAATTNAGNKKWRAYLSTTASKDQIQVNARDRIGTGPWYNAKGIMIAKNLDDLHSANKINKENALSEKGAVIKGRGDTPNQHDILTGSQQSGMASTANCNNWTSNGKGSASLGHHDKKGPAGRISWNSAHESFGCSIKDLKATGGNGYFYCFAQ